MQLGTIQHMSLYLWQFMLEYNNSCVQLQMGNSQGESTYYMVCITIMIGI